MSDWLAALDTIEVTARRDDGTTTTFNVTVRLDTPVEIEYYRNGGILHYVLRNMVQEAA